MTISPATHSSTAPNEEPLERLSEAIERARQLPASPAYEPADGDPLARLRQVLAREATLQAESAPSEWPAAGDDATASPEPSAPSAPNSGPDATAGAPSQDPRETGLEARLGREVLAALGARPLPASARVAAVELLTAQIDQPDPDTLRRVLGILITGQHD